MTGLSGKTVIVTGGASGIGKAVVRLFASEGSDIAIFDLDEMNGRALVEEIASGGGTAEFIQVDVSQAAECSRAVQLVMAKFGGIKILVNNAGIISRTNALMMAEEEWDRVMEVNVKSVFLMSKLVIPIMIDGGGGAIVNTGSGWGLTGGRNALVYCASKAAVVNMTRAMALDHGPQNIRVNCVCPGDTDTSMLRKEARQLEQDEHSFLAEAAERPLRRIGSPEEVARAILYLAGDGASFITGTTLVVDGGGLAGG